MYHDFFVAAFLHGLLKFSFHIAQCRLWISCYFILYVFFPQITDNDVQIIMQNMIEKVVFLNLSCSSVRI